MRPRCVIVQGHFKKRGELVLQDLTPARLNAMYADLLRNGRIIRPGGLAPKTVRHVHTMLHKALHDAVCWSLLVQSPADRADPPKPATPEMHVWSPEQLRTF